MDNLASRSIFCRPGDERALLSYAMRSLDNYFGLKSKMSSGEFLDPSHQLIMVILDSLVNSGAETFDLTMIINKAQNDQILDSIDGGTGYLQSIFNMPISDQNFELYLKNVADSVLKYKLFLTLQEEKSKVEKEAKSDIGASDILCEIENKVFELSSGNRFLSEPRDIYDGLEEYIEEKKKTKIEMSGISTGFPILDKQIDGMIPGTLMIIAARKKRGKSTFLTNIAIHVALRENLPVLYVDTEMSFEEWRTRALARICDVKERDIKHGGYSPDLEMKIRNGMRLIKKDLLFHEYMPGYSVDKLVSLYKKYKLKKNIGLIIFDYLKEPSSDSVDRQRKEYQLLGDVTTKLKDLSGELGIPALTAVQLNRQKDIADSDRVARYGDIIAFWDRRSAEEIESGGQRCGNYKLFIKDSRRGGATPEEGIGYRFTKQYLKIKEVDLDDQYFIDFTKEVNREDDEEELS